MTICSGNFCDIRDSCERFIQYQAGSKATKVGTAMCISLTGHETLYYRYIPKGQDTSYVKNTNTNKLKK